MLHGIYIYIYMYISIRKFQHDQAESVNPEVRLLKKKMQRDPTTQQVAVTAVDNFQAWFQISLLPLLKACKTLSVTLDIRTPVWYILFPCCFGLSPSDHCKLFLCRAKRMTSLSFHWSAPTGIGLPQAMLSDMKSCESCCFKLSDSGLILW